MKLKECILAIIDNDKYNIGLAIENNIPVVCNVYKNKDGKLNFNKGNKVYIYISNLGCNSGVYFEGVCGNSKYFPGAKYLPGFDFYIEHEDSKNREYVWNQNNKDKLDQIIGEGRFIEINDIKPLCPRYINKKLNFSVTIEEINDYLGEKHKFNVRRSRQLTNKEVEYFESLNWCKY